MNAYPQHIDKDITNTIEPEPGTTSPPEQLPNKEQEETGTSHEEEIRRRKREPDEDFKEKKIISDEPSTEEVEGTDSTGENKVEMGKEDSGK